MGYGYSTISEDDQDATSGTAGVVEYTSTDLPGMTVHQLTLINVGGTATGTVPVKFIPVGGTVAEVLYKSDGTTPEEIDLAALATIKVEDLKVDAWVLDLSGITGSCHVRINSW